MTTTSNNNRPLKIVVCGPVKGGKTSIANFISGQTDQLGNPGMTYEATAGARILECEKQPGITGIKVPVEIWDVSGDQSYEACWPAIMKDVDGVILVYSPEIPSHATEVGIWYDQFVKQPKLPEECCHVFVHRTNPAPAPRSRLPPKLTGLKKNVLHSNFTSAAQGQMIASFEDFLRGVHQAASTAQRRK
ncbi:unnamed protein product [Ascophyllum nodosum]